MVYRVLKFHKEEIHYQHSIKKMKNKKKEKKLDMDKLVISSTELKAHISNSDNFFVKQPSVCLPL